MKNYLKKVMSLFMAVLMCLSVLFIGLSTFKPEVIAASAGNYKWRVRIVSENDTGGWNNEQFRAYGCKNNGTSSQTSSAIASKDKWYIDFNGERTNTFGLGDQTTAEFPTKITYYYDFGGGATWRELRFYLYLEVYNNNNSTWVNIPLNISGSRSSGELSVGAHGGSGGSNEQRVQAKSSASTPAKGTITYTVNSKKPAATKITLSEPGAITLDNLDGSSKTASISGTVYDQYGVTWYQAPTWSVSANNASGYTTASVSPSSASDSTTLTVTKTKGTSAVKTVVVKAACGSASETRSVTVYPTYKISYNVSGNGGTSAVPGPDNTKNTSTSSANVTYTIPNNANYTPKKEKGSSSTGTWKFEGWNGTQGATSGSKAGQTITIDNYNDTLYAIFSKTGKATFYWYNSSGTRVSVEKSNTVYNNATQYTFDVPKSSVPATFTANNTTYTFAGWAVDSTSKTTADHAASVTTATRNIKNGNLTDTYSFYALYTGSVTLSYDNNGGSGQPASKTASLTLNCGNNTSAAANTSGKAEFTLNPDNVTMTRQYSSDFVGWKTAKTDANGIDSETAQYKDGTVTWAASSGLPNKITINQNTTVYAAYYDFRYNVKFYDYKGDLIETQAIRHNFSAEAPTMPTDSADPSHRDANSHYVFDHWEYTDGSAYSDNDKLTKFVNGYTYEVWGKYVGHKHIWSDPFNIEGAVTCTTGQTYKMKCTVCGFIRDFESESLGHDFIVTGVAEPTCTRPGSYGKKICRNCGALADDYKVDTNGDGTPDLLVTDENRVIPALGHQFGIEALEKDTDGNYILLDNEGSYIVEPQVVEATCTTAGYYYYECARCGEKLRVGNIPATGHDWDVHEKIEPTCTEKGHKAYTICKNCDLLLDGEDADIPALGHDYVLVAETDSTCTEKGHYAYYECSRCGKFFDTDTDKTEIADISVKDKDYAAHDWQFVDEVAATCTEPGYTGAWLCSVCNALKPDTEPGTATDPLGHDLGEWVETTPATCAAPGEKRKDCSRCDYFVTEEIPALDHVQGEYIPPVDATCLAEGRTEGYWCANCDGYYLEPTVVAKLPHAMETVNGRAPTCTEPGIPDCYRCTLCNNLYLDAEGKQQVTGELGEIPALGHNFTDWVIAKQPTEDEAGRETRRCLRCGTVENREIEALGHDVSAVAAKAATCTEDGNIACYVCANCGKYYADEAATEPLDYETEVRIAALGHDIDEANPTETVDATCAAEGYKKYVCSVCGHTVIETLPKISEHGAPVAYGENIAPTCAAPGQNAGTMCSICGEVLTRPTAIPKLAHTPEADRRDVSAATCTETGFTGDLYCSVCGQKLESGAVIEAKGHTLGALTEVKAATCTEYGEKRRTCANCDYYETYETPVLGHQIVIDRAVPATCTAEGKTEGKHCSRCNAVLVAQETVGMLGHNYTVVVIEPTCTKLGKTVHTCTLCGDTFEDSYVEKVAHVVGTPATCTEAAVCANCGRSFGEALGHDYQLDDAASTVSTCVEHGTRVYKCTRCSDTYSETLPLGEHRYDESTLTPHFTSCTEPGYYTIECSVCHYVYREDAPAPGHNYVNGVCTQCGQAEPSTPDTPDTPASEKCEKCGLNHNGRTGLWKQDGLFCRILSFFRNIFKMFSR